MKWQPGRALEAIGRRVQRRAAEQVRSARGHKPHRDGRRPRRNVGGSLPGAIRRKDMLRIEPWGFVLRWQSLGQKFLWFVAGQKNQGPRPVDLSPEVRDVETAVRDAAVKHFQERDRRTSRRGAR